MALQGSDASASDLGLPSWLSMLEPGVGDGVFMTLKGTLVGLILVLLTMCYYIEDPVRLPEHHISVCHYHAPAFAAAMCVMSGCVWQYMRLHAWHHELRFTSV